MRSIDQKLQMLKIKLDSEDLTGISEFSEWEHGFIESVAEQYEARRSLSQKQMDKISDIYDKYFLAH